ncbi:MAG: NosD domain-containing protein [Promethearchaeota archaeon]|jgi:parallel beta-helix repeat protein
MKSKTKYLVILLAIGLIFPLILNSEINFKNNADKPKTSSVFNGGILIDEFLSTNTTYSGNWTWAVSQPWCYDDNGVYIIEDLIINASTSPTGSGIYIVDSDNEYFIIRNCTIFDAGSGINHGGIRLEQTNNGTLINNNCSNNVWNGIYLDTNCKNNILTGNTVNNNEFGIYVYLNSNNNTISGNTANYNNYGIYLEDVHNNTISGNIANGNTQSGIYSYYCDYNNITGNTASNNNDGIFLEDNCDNNNITYNTVNSNNIGIEVYYGDSNSIVENIANSNEYYGISLEQSNNNTISGNTAYNNTRIGIRVIETSKYNIFSGNTIDHNQEGIFIYVGLNNTIIGNAISNNYVRGIHIDEDSDYNEFTENIIKNNTIGLNINGLNDYNVAYKNFFLNNGKHAFDDGTGNKWNSTAIGNYWDNHTGPDTIPQDGIVDDMYKYIGGSVGSIDYLPIAEDGAPSITINSPDPGDVFNSTAPSFNVRITDVYLDEMWYTLDGGLNNYTFSENGTIDQVEWDLLSEGSVTIMFYARDIVGNVASEEVTVIKDTSVAGLEPGVIAVIVVVSVIGGVVLIGAILVILEKKGKISLEKIKRFSFGRK